MTLTPEQLQRRAYEAASIVNLVMHRLHAVTGDEDSVDLAMQSADLLNALSAAKQIITEMADAANPTVAEVMS